MRKKADENQIHMGWILRTVLIILGVLIIGAAVFFVFATSIGSRQALRDAKNVYLALNTTEIEYYAQNKTIYDPAMPSGLAHGVKSRVMQLVQNEGRYEVLAFDQKMHKVTFLQYQKGRYYVTYYRSGGQDVWEVSYRMILYRWDGNDYQ